MLLNSLGEVLLDLWVFQEAGVNLVESGVLCEELLAESREVDGSSVEGNSQLQVCHREVLSKHVRSLGELLEPLLHSGGPCGSELREVLLSGCLLGLLTSEQACKVMWALVFHCIQYLVHLECIQRIAWVNLGKLSTNVFLKGC